MDNDLHAPLRGKERKPRSDTSLSILRIGLGLLPVIALGGFSIYSVLQQGQGLETARPLPAPIATGGSADSASAATPEPGQAEDPSGVTVTRAGPRPANAEGPLLIEVPATDGSAMASAFADDALLEQTEFGRLPIKGPDGRRPMDRYARPSAQTRGVKISIIVTGLGLSQTGSQKAVRDLPPEVTLAFASTGNSLDRWSEQARQSGHEILLQVPLEPFGYPANDPGPGTLLVTAAAKDRSVRLHRAMGRITGYTGLINYQGGRFLADEKASAGLLSEVTGRGLLFVDDGTTAQSKTEALAQKIKTPYAQADLTLDLQVDRDAILKKLDALERIARQNGHAIGIASAFDESVSAITEWVNEAGGRGLEIVGISALVNEPAKP